MLGKRNFDTVFSERVEYPVVHLAAQDPRGLDMRSCPYPQFEIQGTAAEFMENDIRCGVLENSRMVVGNLEQDIPHFFRVRAVRYSDRNGYPNVTVGMAPVGYLP